MRPNDSPFARAAAVAHAVREAGGRALLVGGCVRDRLLGITPKDIDLEVFGLPVGAVRSLLERMGRVETVGESFTVFKLGDIDGSMMHSTRFVLVDRRGRIRGYYRTEQGESLDPLVADIFRVAKEA